MPCLCLGVQPASRSPRRGVATVGHNCFEGHCRSVLLPSRHLRDLVFKSNLFTRTKVTLSPFPRALACMTVFLPLTPTSAMTGVLGTASADFTLPPVDSTLPHCGLHAARPVHSTLAPQRTPCCPPQTPHCPPRTPCCPPHSAFTLSSNRHSNPPLRSGQKPPEIVRPLMCPFISH